MSEAADADDADAGRGIDAVVAQRAIDGDAAAEQGSGLFAGQGVGNAHDEAGVGADVVGISAVAMDAGGFQRRAEVFEAAAAPLALAAGVGLPAEADALADLEGVHLGTDGSDGPDDLVAGDEGILADAPVV